MKVLISSIGSRGDVQPIIALGVELKMLGHDATLCVAPNFKEWVESFGLTCLPIGPDLKQLTGGMAPRNPPKLTAEQKSQLAAQAVRSQFPVLTAAAKDCDLIVAGGALQLATRSVAEAFRIRYVFAAYCPAVLPSSTYPPARMGTHHPQSLPAEAIRLLWKEDEESWNGLFRETLNEERAKLGLPSVDSVPRHIFTDRPWLAADASIGPAGSTTEMQITQTGAWLLHDPRPLPDQVEEFLSRGAPPVYFGFGSMRSTEGNSRVLIEAARALGLRSIISQGWGNLGPIDDGNDCLMVDDLSHEKLFARVAAVVHHGGAGTTTAAARAGKPQVLVPHHYDQYFWAHRVQALGIGVAGPARDDLTASAMTAALHAATRPDIATEAQAFAGRVQVHGARIAANRLWKNPNARDPR
jgi:vancomycin aglycone glucosyltransferase